MAVSVKLIQCVIPDNWPPTDWEPHVLDFLLTQFSEHPEQLGWCATLPLFRPDGEPFFDRHARRVHTSHPTVGVRNSGIRFWRNMRVKALRLKVPER